MDCVGCSSGAVTERPDLTAQGYCRFRCRDCDKQFNERSDGVLNRASLPSDIIAFLVFCPLRYRLTLRNLGEVMLLRGFTVSHERVQQWGAKLLPVMDEALHKRRHGTGRRSGQSWSCWGGRPHGIECLTWAVITFTEGVWNGLDFHDRSDAIYRELRQHDSRIGRSYGRNNLKQ